MCPSINAIISRELSLRKYNDSGYRVENTVNCVITKYYLDGDKVVLENTGTDSIYYTYDAENNLVSLALNLTENFYIRNGQGDISGLIDTAGTQVVSYVYDSWGKLISIDGSLKDTVGLQNPYRYRSYRYDTETNLYYLQSRYYNPEVKRYINADDVEFIGATGTSLGYNLFAYCENNPVNNIDPSGYLSFGKQWWNKVSFIALVIDLIIIIVPACWSLAASFKAKLAAEKLAKAAGKKALEEVKNRSRKAIIEMFVQAQKDLVKRGLPQLSSAIKAFGGAIVEGFFTIIGSSVGQVAASLFDRLDGRRDGYICG